LLYILIFWEIATDQIKRIVALEGDLIKTLGYKNKYQKIPQGSFWAEGENSGNSLDSNVFGPISLGLITAKATAIVWPPSRFRTLKSELPKQRQPITYGKQSVI
jgi:inner membrane protease subunit 2